MSRPEGPGGVVARVSVPPVGGVAVAGRVGARAWRADIAGVIARAELASTRGDGRCVSVESGSSRAAGEMSGRSGPSQGVRAGSVRPFCGPVKPGRARPKVWAGPARASGDCRAERCAPGTCGSDRSLWAPHARVAAKAANALVAASALTLALHARVAAQAATAALSYPHSRPRLSRHLVALFKTF